MEFNIEVNGKETTICVQPGIIAYPKRNQLEIDYLNQVMRGLHYEQGIILQRSLFRLITEWKYTINFERVPDLVSEYTEQHNYQQMRNWLRRDTAEFHLDNVKLIIPGCVLQLDIYVPQSATVSIVHSKQVLEFDKFYELEPEEDND